MNFKNCSAQSTSYSILALLIVVTLAFIPLQVMMNEESEEVDDLSNYENLLNNKVYGITALIDNELYFNTEKTITINYIKLGGVDCSISGEYKGKLKFDVSSCLNKNVESTISIEVNTNLGSFKDETFVEKNIFSSYGLEE